MSLRIDLDFQHGLVETKVEPSPEGGIALRLVRGVETAVIHMTLESLESLWLDLTVALSELKKS